MPNTKSENGLFAATKGSGVPATMNTTTTTMANNKSITFTMTYTVTKHYELKEEMDFDEFKERYFCDDENEVYAQAVWDKILKEHASKKGHVCLDDGEYEEDGEDGEYEEELEEPIEDFVNEVFEEVQKDTSEYKVELEKYKEQVRLAEEGMELAKERMKAYLDAKNKC